MLQDKDRAWVDGVVQKIKTKMEWVSEKSKNKIPYTTVNGVHDDWSQLTGEDNDRDRIAWWTNGFWAGMMWLMYHETEDVRYADIAELTEKKLDRCFDDYYGLNHDVGFMWLLSAVADYRLTKKEVSRKRGLHAASLLAGRLNLNGQFIRAWNGGGADDTTGWAIIDCMMNLPLLYWASEETKDPRFEQAARMHADTAMKYFIRSDGSAEHIVEFDPYQGGVIKTYGGQGYAQGSSWTRGQSWAIYGFVISYIHTGKKEYLNTVKKVADYFIANIPEDAIIPVDFRQPKEPAWEDSTAAAIASSGLIELARHVEECEQAKYLQPALRLLEVLESKRCNWTHQDDCILENCTESYHNERHHISIIYGDYFFMEAIFKLKGGDLFFW